MSEERELAREFQVASSLITLMDILTEKTREAINSDNENGVIRYEDFSGIAEAVLNSTEYHEILLDKYSAAKTEIRNYFIERSKRSQAQRANQEA